MKNHFHRAVILAGMIGLAGCHKTDYSYSGSSIQDYMPLYVGHSITYQMDSILYTHFGSVLERHFYIVKDSIEGTVTDASDRPSWRMVRYFRDNADTTAWQPGGTCMITPLRSTIEMVENNLRYVKLCMPVQDVYSWAGNGYLPFQPYSYAFDFGYSDHVQLESWRYQYQDLYKKDTINQLVFDNTITVACSRPDSSNFPPVDLALAGNKTVWVERYAKGVGLVYKDVILQEYHPVSPSVTIPYYAGFELRMSIIAYQ